MTRRICHSLVLSLAAAAWVTSPVGAQTTTGQIVGTVKAAGGGPLAAIEVKASSPSLQGVRSAVTAADGRYFLPVLPPGIYTLDLSGEGFVSIRLEGVEVTLGGTAVGDAVLAAGELSETVTVSAEPPLIDTTGANVVVIVPRIVLDRIPFATRDYRELAKLSPGVTATDINMTSGKGPGSPSFRGEGQYGDNYLVDGLTGRNPGDYTPGTPIPFGAIQEVQIVSDGFSPEYGEVLGGLMNVITRSGSNELNGDFSYIYTSSGLADNSEPTLLAQPTGFHNAAPQFNIGGPILKDKLWYFASVDGTNLATSYAAAELAGLGTLPAGTETASGYTGFAKLTAAITPNHNLSFNYTHQDVNTEGAGAASATPEARLTLDHTADRLRVNYQGILSPRTVLELKAGYSREQNASRPSQSADLAMWEIVSYGVSMHNAGFLGEGTTERIDLAGVLTQVWNPGGRFGTHELKAGIEHHLPSASSDGRFTGAAEDVIDTGQNPIAADYGLPDTFNGGNKVQVATQDGPSGTILVPVGLYEFRSLGAVNVQQREWGLFVQDTWTSGRWAVMFGLRADSQESLNDVGTIFSQFELKDTLAPRFSLTVDLTGKGKDILKGAWGRFYDVNSLDFGAFANSQGPFSLRTYQWVGAPADSDFRGHVDDGSANDIHNPANWGFSFEQSTLIPFDYSGVQGPDGLDRWLVEYDHAFRHDLALEVRYVNSQTLPLIEDVNTLDPNTFFRFVAQNTDIKRRDYQAGEIELNARPLPNFTVSASYVHSRSLGTSIGQFETGGFQSSVGSTNYVGVYLDRPPSDPAFWCTFFGPSCLPPEWNTSDPRLDFNNDDRVDQVDFDLTIQNQFAGLGSTQTDDGWYGPLAYAVDDLVKVYGRWDVSQWKGFYLGWFFQWSSGYHMSRKSFVDAYGDFLGYTNTPHYEFNGNCTTFADCDATLVTALEEEGTRRGSIDMPSTWSLDLTLGKLWQLPHHVGLEIRTDIINVFNQQDVLTIQDRSTDTFGEPLSRQVPRSFRLYGTVRF